MANQKKIGVAIVDVAVSESLPVENICVQSGPTLIMDYCDSGSGNPVDTFMYFIPLIAPTNVNISKDPNTTLSALIISRTSQCSGNRFTTQCIFEIKGAGHHETQFVPDEIIAFNKKFSNNPKIMRNMLKSIGVDGPLKGSLVISGTVKDHQREVQKVTVRFDLGGKSPVSAYLYDVKYQDKQYLYENRLGEKIVRINSLIFTRGGNPPTMQAEVGSVASIKESEGFFTSFKAMLANCFLSPMPITEVGSQTMIDFGAALDGTKSAFTFPYATNINSDISLLVAKQIPDTSESPTLATYH